MRLLGQVARVSSIIRVVKGTAFKPADNPANHLGRVGGVVLPEDGTAESSRDGWVEDAVVEGFLVVDGQEERVDSAEGGNVGFDDGDDCRGGVRGEDGRRRGVYGGDCSV